MKKGIAVAMTVILALTVGTLSIPDVKVSAAYNNQNYDDSNYSDDSNGRWHDKNITEYNTPEAGCMVRIGQINNFGFGWNHKNPFNGQVTGVHSTNFMPETDDPKGINKIMVASGFELGNRRLNDGSNGVNDGYTNVAWYRDHKVESLDLSYDTSKITANNATIQIFIDDIQPDKHIQAPNGRWYNIGRGGFSPYSYNKYTVYLNDDEVPEFEQVINSLDEHGPVGQLVTLNVPERFIDKLNKNNGKVSLTIDDKRNYVTDVYGNKVRNTGDGYAVNFVKLLINKKGIDNTGTVNGHVYYATCDNKGNLNKTTTPVQGAKVSVSGVDGTITTDANGSYSCSNVPAGQVVITASKDNPSPTTKTVINPDQSKDITTTTITYTPGTYTTGSSKDGYAGSDHCYPNLEGGATLDNCDIYIVETVVDVSNHIDPPISLAREER